MPNPNPPVRVVRFEVLKASQFRSIHADGAFGGFTPQGQFCFTLYNERFPIPQKMAFRIDDAGRSVGEVPEERVQRDSIIREAEVCVYMSLDGIQSLSKFLAEQLKTFHERQKQEGGSAADDLDLKEAQP